MRLTDLAFEAWLEHAFGPAVRDGHDAWFFDVDADWWDPAPVQAIAHFIRLFEDPVPALAWFHDTQIAQGLTYLVSISAAGDNGWFSDPTVPLDARLRCIAAIGDLFARLFAPRCTPHLGHCSETGGALNGVCYMWWDEFPCIAQPDDPHRAALEEAALVAMARSLVLGSIACQESALHGLGHWQPRHPDKVAGIVDGYLQTGAPGDPRLVAYAHAARSGCVL